jgi:hypothetical protein
LLGLETNLNPRTDFRVSDRVAKTNSSSEVNSS